MTNAHLAMLEEAERLLRAFPHQVVFLGGASVSLHLDDRAVNVRHTKDVDFLIEATSYAENAAAEEHLRGLGFVQPAQEDGPICRWHNGDFIFDMMPMDPTLLGFGASRWFERGFREAKDHVLPNGQSIKALDAVHLIAAKIEAYSDRGEDDWMTSRDVEDIVTVLDGRTAIFEELRSTGEVQSFIRAWLRSFPEDELMDLLGAHLSDYARGIYLKERLAEVLVDTGSEGG